MAATDHHLDEAALVDEYFRDPEASTPALAPGQVAHLENCPGCRRRFSDLSAAIDAVRADAVASADEAFPAERLRAQFGHLMRRLEHAGRPARVLSFPIPASRRRQTTAHPRVAVRWVAAAAAAGLIFGLSVGRLADIGPSRAHRAPLAATELQSLQSVSFSTANAPLAAGFSEDPFLLQVEAAVDQHRIAELVAIDELTPTAHEISLPLR